MNDPDPVGGRSALILWAIGLGCVAWLAIKAWGRLAR